MQRRFVSVVTWSGALAVLMGMACGQPIEPAGDPDGTEGHWTAPRTPWGEPDLQGVWRHQSATPLERPAGASSVRSPEEIAAARASEEQQVALGVAAAEDARPDPNASPFQRNEYNKFWTFTGVARDVEDRTSLIVDPPDGRIPLTNEAAKIQEFHAAYVSNFPPEEHYNNSWRDRDTGERCLTDGTVGHMWGGTGPNQFIQGPGYVVILHEQFRDRRIIPTDGRDPSGVPTWLGNATGRWDGETLVVETTNFLDKTDESWQNISKAASPTMQLVERWTRVGPDSLAYEVTVTDPSKFTQPWTVQLTLTNLASPDMPLAFFEYACAEGNYGIINILSGARQLEQSDPSLAERHTDFERWLSRHPEESSWEARRIRID